MKVVIFDNPDGTITVRNPAQNPVKGSPARRRKGETVTAHFERLVAGPNKKGGVRVTTMDHMDLPAHHEHFKTAREWDGVGVGINMAKARVEHLVNINAARAVRAAELNIREMLGEQVNVEKAMLRDRGHELEINLTQTPAELKDVWQPGTPRSVMAQEGNS